MLSGTPPGATTPASNNSSSTTPSATSDPESSDSPISALLEEDPAAVEPPALSRSASWHSLVQEPESHEVDLTGVDAISVGEVEDDGSKLPSTGESMAVDIAPNNAESDPASSALEQESTFDSAASELRAPSLSIPEVPSLPAFGLGPSPGPVPPPSQTAIIPPLPIIPAGTTMIIQGVVQAAEETGRNQRRRNDNDTTARPPAPATNSTSSETASTHDSTSSSRNAHARLPGTFGDEAEVTREPAPEPESPNGAAELLGALLM